MKYFLYICQIFLFISCTAFSYDTEEKFTLPYSGEWDIKSSRNPHEEAVSVTGGSFFYSVNKNEATAVLACNSQSGRPCGAIYPYTSELNFTDGFAAEVLFSLTAASTESDSETKEYLSRFNWQRFISECREFEDDIWKLDKERIMKKISSGTFKKTDLKVLE